MNPSGTESVIAPSLDTIVERKANEARAEAGADATVFIFILRGSHSSGSISNDGPLAIDSLIAIIVQTLGNLRARVLSMAAERANDGAQPPAGN